MTRRGNKRAHNATTNIPSNATTHRSTGTLERSPWVCNQISNAAASEPTLSMNGRHSAGDPLRHQRATVPSSIPPKTKYPAA